MYEFTLYVVGQRRRSIKAIEDLKALLEADYKGRYSLKIVSITKNPHIAEKYNILATPAVVRTFPLPIRTIVGNFSKRKNVLAALGLT